MSGKEFKTVIAKSGSQIVIEIPFDPNEAWGVKQRHYITGAISGHRIRGPLGGAHGQYFLPLGEAWRRDSGLQAGDRIDVTLTPEGPQLDNLSPDVAAALDAEPEAKAYFESLATFYRKKFIRAIEHSKRAETRTKNITEMIALLKAGKKQR